MDVSFVVLAITFALATASYLIESRRHTGDHLADPGESSRWLERRLARFPKIAAVVRRRLDRHSAAGFLVTATFAIVLGTALVVGVMFDLADNSNGLGGADRWVSSWGSRNATQESTDLLTWITELGSTTVGIAVLAIVAVIDYLRHRNLGVFSFVFLVGGGQWLLINGLKVLVRRDRPDILQLVEAGGFSFPSGHSAAAAACWAAAAFILTRRSGSSTRLVGGTVAVMVAVAVATSRSLLGVHWLSDVIAGTTIGWAWTSLMIIVFSRELRPLAPLAVSIVGPLERIESRQ